MSEPIITFNNRTLRVESVDEGWLIEAQVLASGRQIMIRATGQFDGEMIIMPAGANRVFISSRASEKREEPIDATTNTAEPSTPANRDNRRAGKR